MTASSQVRKSTWGMTRAQVVSSEQIKPSMNDSNGLAYDVSLSGYDSYLFYFFNESGKLAAASYHVSEEYASPNSYLTTYLDLLSKLKKKYGDGSPSIDWSNDLYQDDEQKWGLAIAAEHLKIAHRWETEDTYITAEISGKNYEVSVSIRYMSKEVKLKNQSNELDDF